MKRPSLKLRITGWFALMMFVIEALVLAFLLAVNGTVATNDPEARLVRMVEHNANRVKYNNRQFRFSRIHYNRSGVYTVLYDADGNVLQGTFPAEFTPAQPLPLGSETVRLVDCGDNEYYVYDVRVDMMVGSVWLRGVIDADANGGVMRVILPLAWSLLPVLLVLSVIGGYFIASRALRPVRQLTATANAISDGQDLKARIGLPHTSGSDEIYQLSASFDNMFDRLERSFEAEQRFTSDASHELRTPLTAITGWSETLMFDTAIQGDSRRGIAIISKEAARLTSLVEELLEFTRIQDGRFNLSMELLDIESELEDTIFTYQELLRQDGMQLIYNPPEEEIPLVPGDPERLKQVFLNILDNAAKYARDGKTIEVSVFSDSEAATIQFRDHGPGIPENELPHVKEKFFKGEKHKARGSGIGLAVCDEIITRSGGTLTIANAPGGGTLVSVRLPFAPESGN